MPVIFGKNVKQEVNDMFKKKNLIVTIFTFLLLAFTIYVISDTFLITRVYSAALTEDAPEAEKGTAGSIASNGSGTDSAGSPSTASDESGATSGDGKDTDSAGNPDVDTDGSEDNSKKMPDPDSNGSEGNSKRKPPTVSNGSEGSSKRKPDSDSNGSGTTSNGSPSRDSSGSGTTSGGSASQDSSGSGTTSSGGSDTDTNSKSEKSADASLSAETVSTATQYQDENISVTLTEYTVNDTAVYVADVQVSSAEYLKTAFAQNAYGKNVTDETSDIASGVGAILAINGDYYGSQERGYVLRNGVLYRSIPENGQEDLVIYEDGSFEIITETEISAEELLTKGAVQILSFGPALVEEGSLSVSQNDEVGRAKSSNPRTAIGIIDALHYVFVVSDGRTGESEGLSLYELGQFMESLGVSTAYNLDGGGSSTIYFNGQVINNPTTNGNSIKERKVSDIVYIGY